MFHKTIKLVSHREDCLLFLIKIGSQLNGSFYKYIQAINNYANKNSKIHNN